MGGAARQADPVVQTHRLLLRTEAEGPGARAALWVQGCTIGCPGCFNAATWDPAGGFPMRVSEIARRVACAPDIEGITLVGGEPFQQAAALADLAGRCRARGLSVVTFTGYCHEVLAQSARPDWRALLDATDLLLAGPYVARLRDFSRPWVGSANQEFVFLTDRYRHLAADLGKIPNRLEVSVGAGGRVALNGLPEPAEVGAFRNALAGLGLRLAGRDTETFADDTGNPDDHR